MPASALQQQLQHSLGSAYTLERELGGGGMARVFVAQETALGRTVVVKALAPELAQELSAERFAREIQLSARLQHPNIVPVLTAGAADGVPYYTMPYVEGESLRAWLAHGGPLPLDEALSVLRDVARALAYAHAHGVVHRDVKPENVLLSDGVVIVADFGIAKAVDAARTQGDPGTTATLTRLGMALGTPAYMAPEQAIGDPGVDFRADLYALGVLAYELLAGVHPFAGRPSAHSLLVAHLTEAPVPLETVRPEISSAVASLVMRCLEKDPARRPAGARALVDGFGAVLLHARAAGAGSAALGDVGPPGRAAARPSVAVLPMVNVSGDPENEHFSAGLTDELIGALSQVAELTVSGRTSVFALEGKGLTVRAIADALQVSNVLEGSVRRAGQRLKVRVQLVNADGTVLWSEAYDRMLTDVFAVQEEIAQAVVRALEIRLGAARGPLVRPPTTDLAAYDLFLKGRFARRRLDPGDLPRAIGYFEQAVSRDPHYAGAYAALSDARLLLIVFAGLPAYDEGPRARAYAVQAVELDPALADAHWALGQVLAFFDFDWPRAEQELEHALSLDPGHVDAQHKLAIVLLHQGRFDEALAALTRTLAADPLLSHAHMTLGRLYLSRGQPDHAIPHLLDALELSPAFAHAREQLAHAYLLQGRTDDALAECDRAVATGGVRERALLAYVYARAGRRAEAATLLDALLAPDGARYVPPFQVAMAYTGLGDVDAAFAWLERACEERDPQVTSLVVMPAFAPLRADPRYAALLRRLGLAAGP